MEAKQTEQGSHTHLPRFDPKPTLLYYWRHSLLWSVRRSLAGALPLQAAKGDCPDEHDDHAEFGMTASRENNARRDGGHREN
jgi:hypothetical protein